VLLLKEYLLLKIPATLILVIQVLAKLLVGEIIMLEIQVLFL
jgi:hypothetical protein